MKVEIELNGSVFMQMRNVLKRNIFNFLDRNFQIEFNFDSKNILSILKYKTRKKYKKRVPAILRYGLLKQRSTLTKETALNYLVQFFILFQF